MFTIPDQKSLENAVRAIVASNYPLIASRGLLNVSIGPSAQATAPTVTDTVVIKDKTVAPMIWGTAMWGGSKVSYE